MWAEYLQGRVYIKELPLMCLSVKNLLPLITGTVEYADKCEEVYKGESLILAMSACEDRAIELLNDTMRELTSLSTPDR